MIIENEYTECNNSKVGNMVCDDENNILECEYDHGDCCLHDKDKAHCDLCTCHTFLITTFTPCKFKNM